MLIPERAGHQEFGSVYFTQRKCLTRGSEVEILQYLYIVVFNSSKMVITSQNTPNVFSVFLFSGFFFCTILSLITWAGTPYEFFNLVVPVT